MTRPACQHPIRTGNRGPKFVAIIISFAVISFVYLNLAPTSVDADPLLGTTIVELSQLASAIPPLPRSAAGVSSEATVNPPVPMPREIPPMPREIPLVPRETTTEDSPIAEDPSEIAVTSPPSVSYSRLPMSPKISDANVLTGRTALLVFLSMLENSSHKLNKFSDYTTTFFKQERVGGDLGDAQVVELKMRHSPFSVYMKWIVGCKGRQVLYVDGKNDGKILVQLGGWKRRFPAIKLDPNGSLAMKESRYPITKSGLLEIVKMAIAYRKHDLRNLHYVGCQMIDGRKFEKSDCLCFVVEYASQTISEVYRKSIMYIDKNSLMPVLIKNFTWPKKVAGVSPNNLDQTTLIEFYTFTNTKFDQRLANTDFDRKSYKFR